MKTLTVAALAFLAVASASAQTDARQLAPLLGNPIQSAEVTSLELRRYLLKKVPSMPSVSSAAQWTAEAKKLRQKVLAEFVFRGWPHEWIDAPVKVEDLGPIPSGKGYRMRKLRYEIVPHFYSTAILYEPETLQGKAPAILNTNGHVGAPGKAIEYKQKRCINQALRGMIALNVEWPGMGELSQPGNAHFFYAHLDLVGSSGLGLFYLTVRKALDYLYTDPHVDQNHIGMTGLSGGGFQTILLSALDERIWAAVPVAGFAADTSRIERVMDNGDIEHHASDMLATIDYPLLVALRAPRPTLLIYNAEDDCCYRAPLVKPYIFDQVKPFFRLYGKEDVFAWHQNTDPSTHNYQLDNRQQAYRFFTSHFNLPVAEAEIPVDSQIKSFEELRVGLPEDSLTILGVARKLATGIERPVRSVTQDRARLRKLIRYQPSEVEHAWPLRNSYSKGLETIAYRFDFPNGLSATGVWLKAIAVPSTAPSTLILDDKGKKNPSTVVSDRVNRGEQVLATDLVFTGDVVPQDRGAFNYAELLAGLGDRALGLEVAQLIGVSRWLRATRNDRPVRLETAGMRSQVTALVAVALEPGLFSGVVVREGITSLRYLLDQPVEFTAAPDLFCLGLYREFDLDRLAQLGAPARISIAGN